MSFETGCSSALEISGVVTAVKSPLIYAELYGGSVGGFVRVSSNIKNRGALTARIVAFEGERCFLSPLGSLDQITVGDRVDLLSVGSAVTVPRNPLGCVLDAEGRVLSALEVRGNYDDKVAVQSIRSAPGPLDRVCTFDWFQSGISTIDALLPLWAGQRLAVLAEPGVGKTSLMRSLAGQHRGKVNVIALVGERGVEVNQFVEELRADGGLQRSVVVVSTSDEPPLRRAFAAYTAVAIAEYLAAQENQVLLLFDSMTRFARALREIGLASGEIPVRRGYPASVFRQLPELIERTGPLSVGSITAFFTVLKSGTIDEDPITEEICSLTDGHITLSKALAEAGVFPAIDIVTSLSRNSERVIGNEDQEKIRLIKAAFSHAAAEEDLIRMGGQPLFETTVRIMENRTELNRILSDGNIKNISEENWQEQVRLIRNQISEIIAPVS